MAQTLILMVLSKLYGLKSASKCLKMASVYQPENRLFFIFIFFSWRVEHWPHVICHSKMGLVSSKTFSIVIWRINVSASTHFGGFNKTIWLKNFFKTLENGFTNQKIAYFSFSTSFVACCALATSDMSFKSGFSIS